MPALSLKFEENVLRETNSFELHLTDKNDLAGVPDNIIEDGCNGGCSRNRKGWIFTLHFPSYIPFMQYSEKRELREKMYRAYSSRGFRGNEYDNREIIIRIVNLRLEMARLLGFKNFAEMILGDRMADTQSKVEKFLEELFKPQSLPPPGTLRISENLHQSADISVHLNDGTGHIYSEKLKKKIFNIDDEILKPYFRLEDT